MNTSLKSLLIIPLLIVGCNNNDDENTLKASGNIEVTEITVSSKVTGEVKEIFKKEGELVKEIQF